MTIAGPRNHFYQWDNNAVLMVSGCDEVHFCHAGDEKAIIVDVAYHSHCCYDHPVHGHFTEPGFAKVPVRLLESDEPLIAYGYENKNTYVRFEFNVEARPKPSSYVTPSEIPRWTTLEEELKKKMPLPTRPGKKDYILVNNGFGGGKWVDPEEVSIGGSIPFTGDPIVLERKASLPQVTVADYEADDPGFLTRYAVFHIYDGATEYKSYTVFPQFDGVSYETDAESGAVTTKFSYAYYECLDADGSGTIFTFDYENDSWSRENVTNVGENAVYTVSDTAVPNTKVINDVGYSPEKGSVLIVKFTTAVGAGAKFRINNLGNTPTAYKDIYHKGAAITNGVIGDGDTGVFVYDGTLFNLVSVDTWDEGDPGDESIFIAKYGETTNDELEQAYQAGKTLFVSRDGRVSFFDERFSPTSYRFYFQDRGDVTVTLCRNNVWSEQVVSNLQCDKAYYFPIAEGTTYSPRMRDIIKSASSTGVADTIVVGVSLKDGGAQEDNVEVACSILSPYNSETGKYGIDSEGREFVRLTGIYDNKIVTFDVANDGEDGNILWTGRQITPIDSTADQMIVNVTYDAATDTYSTDKTYAEVLAAINDGGDPLFKLQKSADMLTVGRYACVKDGAIIVVYQGTLDNVDKYTVAFGLMRPDGTVALVGDVNNNLQNIRDADNGGVIEGNVAENTASGYFAHGEGSFTEASGDGAHAEGFMAYARGDNSHAEGEGTVASGTNQHVQGTYNIADEENRYSHIVGNGTNDDERSNAHTLDRRGNAWFGGKVTAGADPSDDMDLVTKRSMTSAIANAMTDVDNEHFHPVTVLPNPADEDPAKRPKENHEYIVIEYEQDGTTIKSETHYLFYGGAYHEKKPVISLDGYATEAYVLSQVTSKAEIEINESSNAMDIFGGGRHALFNVNTDGDMEMMLAEPGTYLKTATLPSKTNVENAISTGVTEAKSYTDNKTLAASGWGVAKTGTVEVTFNNSQWGTQVNVDLSDLGLASPNDYVATAEIVGATEAGWGGIFRAYTTVPLVSGFDIGAFANEAKTATVTVRYIVVAKGYGAVAYTGEIPTGGTKGQVLTKRSDAEGDYGWQTQGAFVTNGDWRYKINSDNTFEAYYSKSGVSLTIQDTSGNFYRSALQTLTLPAGITSAYDATPLHASVNTSHNNYPCFGTLASVATNQVKYYALSGGSGGASPNYIVTAHVFGTLTAKA